MNGEVYQGIDMNHRECLITRSGKAGETLTIDLQAYTGIMHEEFALRTQIEEIDAEIENSIMTCGFRLQRFPAWRQMIKPQGY